MEKWMKLQAELKAMKIRKECCEHIILRYGELHATGGVIIINSDGKKVCRKCCDHHDIPFGLEPFINKKGKRVCLDCCEHNIVDENNSGMYRTECFSGLPYGFRPSTNTGKLNMWRGHSKK